MAETRTEYLARRARERSRARQIASLPPRERAIADHPFAPRCPKCGGPGVPVFRPTVQLQCVDCKEFYRPPRPAA